MFNGLYEVNIGQPVPPDVSLFTRLDREPQMTQARYSFSQPTDSIKSLMATRSTDSQPTVV